MFTKEEKKAAFDLVADQKDWKNPIDAFVEVDKATLVRHAIRYYTGGEATFRYHVNGKYRVTAPGYYVSIGC